MQRSMRGPCLVHDAVHADRRGPTPKQPRYRGQQREVSCTDTSRSASSTLGLAPARGPVASSLSAALRPLAWRERPSRSAYSPPAASPARALRARRLSRQLRVPDPGGTTTVIEIQPSLVQLFERAELLLQAKQNGRANSAVRRADAVADRTRRKTFSRVASRKRHEAQFLRRVAWRIRQQRMRTSRLRVAAPTE
jgi:hypothetical protein